MSTIVAWEMWMRDMQSMVSIAPITVREQVMRSWRDEPQ
jgi:hypothetical protein